MTVARAHGAVPRVDRPIHILDFFRRRVRIAEARVDGDVRRHANELAERHELVQAHVVGLHGVPRVVKVGRTLVAVADGVVPIEVGEKVAAGQAPEAGVELAQQRNGIRPKALHIVRRHQRDGADVKIPRAGAGDSREFASLGIGLGGEVEREFPVRAGNRGKGDGLVVVRALTPDQRDLHAGAESAAKVDVTVYCLPLTRARPDCWMPCGVAASSRCAGSVRRQTGAPCPSPQLRQGRQDAICEAACPRNGAGRAVGRGVRLL